MISATHINARIVLYVILAVPAKIYVKFIVLNNKEQAEQYEMQIIFKLTDGIHIHIFTQCYCGASVM